MLGPPSSGLLRVGTLGEVPGEDFNRIFMSFPGVSLPGLWSGMTGLALGQGVISQRSWP